MTNRMRQVPRAAPAVRRKHAPGSLRAIEIFRAVEEPLHLHLPSAGNAAPVRRRTFHRFPAELRARPESARPLRHNRKAWRSEEHTSELQSHHDLVCRLLLEKKKK